MTKLTVGIIFGGRSGEHEVSVRSAKSVIQKIDREKYEIIPIAITKDGKWLNPIDSAAMLPAEVHELIAVDLDKHSNEPIALLADTAYSGLTKFSLSSDGPAGLQLDVAFPVLHGTYGEDGAIQGLFEMANVPYIGCGVLASSCGMDKVVMKKLFHDAGLPMCKYIWFLRSEFEADPNKIIARVKGELGLPAFIKPANLGSSVGISKAIDENSLRTAIELAAEYDRKIIVEEALEMREIECAVIGNDTPLASLPGEYIINDESKKFLDYTEKYAGTGNNEFVVPAPVSDDLSERIQQMAIKAFQAVDGSGLARVDFFLRKDRGTLLINEINTLPGLTDASGFPKMWAGSGMPFSEVIDKLVDYALARHQDKLRNKTQL
jgi:D-alanine-D-alanine ligase